MKEIAVLQRWVRGRWRMYATREKGLPPPWTTDTILQEFRFCNVHRENDSTTRWIKEHWRDNPELNIENMAFAMIAARLINLKETLADIPIYLLNNWHEGSFHDIIQCRMVAGKKTWTSAYMVTGGGVKEPKHIIIGRILSEAWAKRDDLVVPTSLAATATHLQMLPGIGSFLAAQVVADLKYTPVLAEENTPDWWTWCAPGPGSMRGLSRIHGRYLHSTWNEGDFQKEVVNLLPYINEVLLADEAPAVHAQDAQNCLCEYDKYCRVFYREGNLPRQRYDYRKWQQR